MCIDGNMTQKRFADRPFFVPYAKDSEQAQEVWTATRKFAQENCPNEVSENRIFSIEYRHEGSEYYTEVGQPEPRTGETVLVILKSNPYLVCTENRGVLRGIPVLVGKNEARVVTHFKDDTEGS